MSRWNNHLLLLLGALTVGFAPESSRAENLYSSNDFAGLSRDQRASQVGDILTILVVQAAEASTSMQNNNRRSTELGGGVHVGGINEDGEIGFNSGYSGRGEVRRAERFVTQLSVSITEILPGGGLAISGSQMMQINGEDTVVTVRGRIRVADIDADNRIASTRIADAQINYNGRGFVSRSSRPGIINRIFNFFGLG